MVFLGLPFWPTSIYELICLLGETYNLTTGNIYWIYSGISIRLGGRPSGNSTVCCGKSSFFIGNFVIYKWWIFHSYKYVSLPKSMYCAFFLILLNFGQPTMRLKKHPPFYIFWQINQTKVFGKGKFQISAPRSSLVLKKKCSGNTTASRKGPTMVMMRRFKRTNSSAAAIFRCAFSWAIRW